MTYGEASTSRTAIGSGLIYHGVREVSRHDLNKHLVLSFLTKQICCEYIWADVKHISIWNQGACIGLYFINRPEWIIVDHACSAYSYVSVPLYDTLGMFTTQNDYTIVLLFIYDLSSDSFCVLYICTFRPRCCSIHCEPCSGGSNILCASNSKHCEL